MRAPCVAVLALLCACGGGGTEAPTGGTTPRQAEEQTPEGEPSTPELDPPEPPGADSVLSTLDPARLEPTDEDQMRELSGASAPRVFFVGMIPLLAAQREPRGDDAHDEPGCPQRVVEEGATVLRGGCTDAEGTRWTGSAVVRGMNEEQRTGDITYRGFGFDKTVGCPGGSRPSHWRADGRFVVEQERFTIDVAFRGEGVDDECNDLIGTGGLAYEGRSSRTGSAVRWSGSGRYGWEGFGVVEAATDGELINQRNCQHEALMGTTTVRGAEHTVTFRYDGAEDCDEESTVSWSFDDQAQGELEGVACSATDRPRSRAGAWWPVALVLVLLRSSRGRPCRTGRSA